MKYFTPAEPAACTHNTHAWGGWGKGGESGEKGKGFNAMVLFLRVKDLRSRLIGTLMRLDDILDDMDVLEGDIQAMI